MQTDRDVAPVADAPVHEGEMLHRVERGRIGVAGELAELGAHREGAKPLDQFLPRLTVGNEVGDRDALELVLRREGGDLLALHDGAVVVGELADRRDRRQAGEPAKIDRSLGVA
jgi:hypothetical protein